MKINQYLSKGLVLAALLAGTAACKKSNHDPLPTANRTVIVYMEADNNLYQYAKADINEMERGWNNQYKGRVVVYLAPAAKTSVYASGEQDYNENPRLMLISSEQSDRIASRVLKQYTRSQNPADAATLAAVIQDAVELAPAEEYALVLWSHGTGWAPQGMVSPLRSQAAPQVVSEGTLMSKSGFPIQSSEAPQVAADVPQPVILQSFAHSMTFNSEMDIDALSAALSGAPHFKFILFDACYMGCIEVAYQLRNRADYVLASAAESYAEGYPYNEVLGDMLALPAPDVVGMATKFFNYYNGRPDGPARTVTTGVVRTDKLEALATTVKNLGAATTPILSANQEFGINTYRNTFWDLGDFIHTSWRGHAGLAAVDAALADAVIYKASTPWLFNQIQVNTFSGWSCYIPKSTQPQALNVFKTRFDWSTASGFNALVP